MDTGSQILLLDHGYVKYVEHMGSDLSPLESARMSTAKETGVDEAADTRLLNRLWGDQHSTPFESCELTVEISCPIFVLRQLDRHRTVSYDDMTVETVDEVMRSFTSRNEFSGRYSVMPDLFYIPKPERIKRKGTANKQGSAEPLSAKDQGHAFGLIVESTNVARKTYERLIEMGVASEVARVALPLNQFTKVRLKANLLNWFKFLNLRLRPDVQWESRIYAQAIGRICRELWPRCWAVFEEHTLLGCRLSRTERRLLCRVLSNLLDEPDNKDIDKLCRKLAAGPDLLEIE
jgi:thymidylate synthase (FAD)